MILTVHRLQIKGECPVDGAKDVYDVTVTTTKTIAVEEILEVAKTQTSMPRLQEDLTWGLSKILGAQVKTVGEHSGVTTTCEAGEA